ncbi:Interleukin-13 receptor subunit alpha-2 [Merluccius polli]|uniref:Interleukin-13 receptor subunit alpha-2 n=1 Tax=Merluccius polli TaxID=89951 RepID=A0AA47NVK4_MERPO|nr:Interleukin-13 receptor subunit alpha-2 [Merluccius polli]
MCGDALSSSVMEPHTCWPSVLLLLLLHLQGSSTSDYNMHTLEAPRDLQVTDPGYLGLLQVQWRPPALKHCVPPCRVHFYLTYYNTFHNRWSVIRTPFTSHRVQFDLSKEMKVRVHTLLDGSCTNGTEVMSTRYAELVRTPEPGSPVVQGLGCVFHRREFTECTWKHTDHNSPASQYRLYYWYGKLGATRECPQYIIHNGAHRGCNFTWNQLPDFSHISICVNSSAPSKASTPAYLYLKIQDHVKPAATEELSLKVVTDPEPQLQLTWGNPVGRIPGHCLQWEVEHSPGGPNGRQPTEKWTVTMETSLRKPLSYDTQRACFRVRSKLVDYCAERGLWSDWSHWKCHKDNDA